MNNANLGFAQETCRQCAAVLYPQFPASDLIFAIGQDVSMHPTYGKQIAVYYIAIFARVDEGGTWTRKLLERGPMSARVAEAWSFLEARLIRAIDKLVQEVETKVNLKSRDRDCRIVFNTGRVESALSGAASSAESQPAPPSYLEAEASTSLPILSSKKSSSS